MGRDRGRSAGDAAAGDARAEYARRRERWAGAEARWARLGSTVSNLRLAVFLAGVVVAWFVFGPARIPAGWLGLSAGVFVGLVVVHDRLIRSREHAERAVAFYARGIARMEDRWVGQGNAGERFRDGAHTYSEDLDLFGRGGLFELLCEARTVAGEDALAAWLCRPADPDAVRERQEAVEDLRGRLDLRENLALIGADVREGMDPIALRKWGAAPAILVSRGLRITAGVLAALSVGSLVLWAATDVGPGPFALAALVQMLFASRVRTRVRQVVREGDAPARGLMLFSELLARLEAEVFTAPLLVRLQGRLATGGVPPSRRVARLRRRIDLLDARRNQLFMPLAALLLWATQLSLAIEAWRAACGAALGDWIDAVGDLEALGSLAGFAYEHADHPFPEIVAEGPRFAGKDLGHPLIPADERVGNDVELGGDLRVLMVSGSNMSGKSTLLRTLGVNTVLALAGAPVCAQRLVLSPLAVGASLRSRDSLQEHKSRFYAEIERLRQIVVLSEGAPPAFFLLDEILHGTNSHDRGVGAAAVVRELIERGAIGVVTTHDLALARVADDLAPAAANVHFQDHLENGEIAFDYRMQPGVVTKSNALALMRAVGLEV
jgi:hypothetical protein